MVPDRTQQPFERHQPKRRSRPFVNGLIGAVAALLLSFIPLSTVLGGAIAGYLEGGTNDDGLKVGTIAGVIMFIPFLLIGYLFAAILVFGDAPGLFSGFVIFVLLLAAFYTIGAAMVGGLVGVYLSRELDEQLKPTNW